MQYRFVTRRAKYGNIFIYEPKFKVEEKRKS